MITSLRLINFKNFADETLKVGPFTVIIGANASGKSNIRDAFRFLHGIGRGYTLAEIVEGKSGRDGQVEWDAIRGAPAEVVRFKPSLPFDWSSLSLGVELEIEGQCAEYSIEAGYNPHSVERFRLQKESLKTQGETVYFTEDDSEYRGLKAKIKEFGEEPTRFSRVRPVLSQLQLAIAYQIPITALDLYSHFRNISFMELYPDSMRHSSVSVDRKLGDHGENLTDALEAICREPDRKKTLLSWLHELVPMDVQDFDFPQDSSGRLQLQFIERNGRKVSAYSASDGTLRFLGVLTALLSPNRANLYFFEDLDTGIHPSRLWLLLDFIERQTADGGVQVITTTHSPALLTWMSDKTFEHTSVVYRDDYWSDSVIRPIADLYNLRELRNSHTLGELFTSNWIGEAMKFSEGESDTDHLDDDDQGRE